MDRTTVITLVKETKAQDSIGQWVSTLAERDVYAEVKSVSRSEWFDAGRNGLKPEFVFVINSFDWDSEELVKYNGSKYSVYRTYYSDSDRMELYCEKKGGVS